MYTRSQFIELLIRNYGFSLKEAIERVDNLGLVDEEAARYEESLAPRVPLIPRLIEPGDSLHSDLNQHLIAQQLHAFMNDPLPEDGAFDSKSFLRRGVEGQCSEILEYIRKNRTRPISKGGCSEDGGQYAKQWCYLLLSYCADHGEPLPDRLLDLAFKIFGCAEHRFTRQSGAAGQRSIADDFDLGVSEVKDIDVFIKAAELEGRAQADGVTLSLNQLANKVGASRASIRRWRQSGFYKSRAHHACAMCN